MRGVVRERSRAFAVHVGVDIVRDTQQDLPPLEWSPPGVVGSAARLISVCTTVSSVSVDGPCSRGVICRRIADPNERGCAVAGRRAAALRVYNTVL